ncbi:MAG: ABC transporter permease [Spirochaetia bacterium]|jgi:ribose transport system permease protein|nr:ABC transporter permease [Spirochaetia bacterium]
MATEEKKATGGTSVIRKILKKGSNMGILMSLLLLCVVIAIATPRFLSLSNLSNVLSQASLIAIYSVGQFLAILTAGIDLSIGSCLALSIMIMGIVAVNLQANPFIAMLACLGMGTLFGFFNAVLLTKLRLPHPFISTIGTKMIGAGLALLVTGTLPINGFPKPVLFLGETSLGLLPVSVILVIVVYVIMYLFMNRTKTGRYIYAVGGNIEAARLSGINTGRVLMTVYSLSGFFAALAGIVLVGRVDSAYPLAGKDYDTDSIAAVIIGGSSFAGGVGEIQNTLIGVLIISVLRNGLNLLNVNANMQTVVIGGVIILAVYVDVLKHMSEKK